MDQYKAFIIIIAIIGSALILSFAVWLHPGIEHGRTGNILEVTE